MRRSLSDPSSVADYSSFVAPPFKRTETIEGQLGKDLGSNGLGRVLRAAVEAPVDFSMAMAQGWHNLPSLYGQKVRKVDTIKDFTSGVKEGGKVFP